MASKIFSRIVNLAVAVAICLAAVPTSAFAAAPATDLSVKEHPFKFYLDPLLVPDMNFAQTVLTKYVADMNFILAKNTDRHLVFNPATDIILTSTQPQSNSATPPMPVEGFEIWAHAVHTDFPISYGGYAGMDDSGAGVLAGLKWTKLYDPDQLKSTEVTDYWTQINNMLHELAHVFGAGYGEYYNLSLVQDATGVSPVLNINLYNQNDSFWSDKPDFRLDPLLRNLSQNNGSPQATDRAGLLDLVKFSALTATIISNNYRNAAPLVDLSHVNVKIISSDGQPLEAANVKVWSVIGSSPYDANLLADDLTNNNGEFSFAWGGGSNPHNSYDFLRLIKVYKDGYIASAKYISIFDADIVKLVDGSDTLNITIQLDKVGTLPLVSTFADVSMSGFAWSSIERLYASKITVGCSATPLMYCPDQTVTRAQMAVFLERGMKGASYIPPSVPSTFGDTTNHWAEYWISALATDGITSGCGAGNYCPNDNVSRAQMAIFLLRAMHGSTYTPTPATGTVFQDVPANYWAAAWIEQLAVEGITSGCGNGSYCPDALVTRAQMSIFLVKAFTLP
jgi:hypothetical protein